MMNDEGLGQAMAMSALEEKINKLEKTINKPRNYSIKATEWLDFSSEVFKHIENYVVPQYGDNGEDPCTEYDEKDFVKQMEKYLKRYGKNSRAGQQKLDLMKIAHYACMLHAKLIAEESKAAALPDEVIFHHSV